MTQAVALREQRLMLGLRGLELVDLSDLEHQQIQVALARARPRAELLQLAPEAPRALVGLEVGGAKRELVGPAEGVEHLELRRGDGQPAVLVLAQERDEPAAQVAQ